MRAVDGYAVRVANGKLCINRSIDRCTTKKSNLSQAETTVPMCLFVDCPYLYMAQSGTMFQQFVAPLDASISLAYCNHSLLTEHFFLCFCFCPGSLTRRYRIVYLLFGSQLLSVDSQCTTCDVTQWHFELLKIGRDRKRESERGARGGDRHFCYFVIHFVRI